MSQTVININLETTSFIHISSSRSESVENSEKIPEISSALDIADPKNKNCKSLSTDLVIWYIHVDDVEWGSDEWLYLHSTLTREEQNKVNLFLKKDDQKRALLSTLIQKALIRHTFGATDAEYEIKRTREVIQLYIIK
jgi:hypothetical protein